MSKNYLIIDKFYGGLSLGSRLGIDGSFRWAQGANYKDDPDALTANLALVKDSGTTVVDLPKWIVPNGADIYAYGDTGKLYKKSSGTWAVDRSVSNSTGQGLGLYSGYLYYRQNTQIGRKKLSDNTFVDDWKKTSDDVQTITDWGVMETFLDFIAFANGRYLATWNDVAFTYNRLSFPSGYHIRDIGVMGEYLVLAVNDNEDITKATKGILFFWDGSSSTYNFFNEVMEGAGISSIEANQEGVYVFPGSSGNIYEFNGKTNKVKKLPLVGLGKTIYIYPGAVSNYNGMCNFGLAGGTSTTVKRGVYAWGSPEISYPKSLNFENPISSGNTTGTTLSIGAVKAIGSSLYVGWKDNTTYGIDLLSTSTLQTTVTVETRIFTANRKINGFRQKLFFKPLLSGEQIELKVKTDQTSTWTSCGVASYTADGGTVTEKLLNYEFQANDVEFQIILTGSSTMPTLNKVIFEYEEDSVL